MLAPDRPPSPILNDYDDEADRAVAAHVALRRLLVPNDRILTFEPPGLFVSATDIACPTCNSIYVYQDSADREVIAEMIRMIAARGLPFHLSIRGSLTSQYGPVAAQAGLVPTADLPLMILLPQHFRPLTCPPELEVRILPPDSVPVHLDLVANGLGMNREGLDLLMSPANRASSGWTTYIGEVDGALAVTGSSLASADGAGLISIATDPAFGRRGFGGALTSVLIADAFASGVPRIFLHSSEQGYRLYERLGFRTVEHLAIFGQPQE